jgi:hypothetical protein
VIRSNRREIPERGKMSVVLGKKRQRMDEDAVKAGYTIIRRENDESPSNALFEELKEHVGKQTFDDLRRSVDNNPGKRVRGGTPAERLLHHGADVSLVLLATGVQG